ncbi:MAG: hypothetical protein NTV54_12710 [Ignavibacteriales bacterium]|nr:hypothetical protein [Ignavibacteriales bacterium]
MNANSSFLARLLTVLVLIACVMSDGPAYAQAAKQIVKVKKYATAGVLELGGSASLEMRTAVVAGSTASKSSTTLEAAPYIGYFVTDGFVLGLRPLGFSFEQPPTGSEVIKINTYFAPGYNFDTQSNVYPYVEGLVGYTSVSKPDLKGISYGGSVGIKMLLPNRGIVNLSVKYVMETLNPSGASTRNGENILSAAFGYSVWF